MGTISLQIPQIGVSDTTEDVKVANNFTALQTAINGNIDDSNLGSPNNGVPRLLYSTFGQVNGSTSYAVGGASFIVSPSGSLPFPLGVVEGGGIPMWFPAAGSWAVARKTTNAFVHLGFAVNAVVPNVSISGSLFKLTSFGGSSSNMSYNGTLVAGSTTSTITPGVAGLAYSTVSSAFILPTDTSAYTLIITLSGGAGTITAGSMLAIVQDLYVFNS